MEARFTGAVRDLLAKRASWHCSNPACGILTVGPTNALFKGLAVPLIEEIFRVPVFIQKIFSVSEPTGHHSRDLVFALPHGWASMHDVQ